MKTPPEHACPLCGSRDLAVLDHIEGDDLAAAWQRGFGIATQLAGARIVYRHCRACGLRSFDPPHDGDAALYEALQRHDWYYMEQKPEFQVALQHIPPSGPVLEVGSGRAAFALLAGTSRYVGLEFNDAAIERARRAGVALVKESVESHARDHAGHYVAVVSFQVLEHVRDPAAFVAACVAALTPGGTLVLAVPDHDGLCGMAQNDLLDLPPHHVTRWNEQALRHVGRLLGLEVSCIVREEITDEHRSWLQRIVMERRLRRWLGLGPRVLDVRPTARVIARLARGLARWVDPAKHPVSGHTIVAVYRKPA